ncbi:MAG: FAD-dependent oxidoreductase [Pseudomonadales bacterium]|nr:FAD-dependent oxidoreductase [Pseudomonadales bacterium]
MEQAPPLVGPDLAIGVPLAELAENMPLLGHAGGKAIVLVRTGADIRAISATCSHYGGPLGDGLVVGKTIRCPWHHACFDLNTGEARGAPALDTIACYEVERRDDRVIVRAQKRAPGPAKPSITLPTSIVIVGAGAAGSAAAERLRALGHTGSITLIGNESSGPVDRPNLSKDYLAGTAPEEWVSLRSRQFYEQIKVDLRTDDPAAELNPSKKSLLLQSGRTVPYDALLLATGAEPRRLALAGSDLPTVFTLRTLNDAKAIIAAARTARRAVIVGSSFIGLEAAAALRTRGLEVAVVSRDRVPLERVLGAQLGQFVQALHEKHGVRFHLTTSPRAIHTQTVELENGVVLEADFVVLGVGVRPRVALATKAGLKVDDGIVVDSHLRTSFPGVWAAGDIARYPDPRQGTSVRIEHWVLAQRQGQSVARDMLGLGERFRDVPFFWSRHYDVTLSYVGHATADDAIEVLGNIARHDATVIYRRAGRPVAVVTVGRDRLSLAIEAALERDDVDAVETLLADN